MRRSDELNHNAQFEPKAMSDNILCTSDSPPLPSSVRAAVLGYRCGCACGTFVCARAVLAKQHDDNDSI